VRGGDVYFKLMREKSEIADVMLFKLVITGSIIVGRPACRGIAKPAYLGKVAPYDFSSNL
jgi:hypothetical protein